MNATICLFRTVCMGLLVLGGVACTRHFPSGSDGGLTADERARLDQVRNGESPVLSNDLPSQRMLLQQGSRPIAAHTRGLDSLIKVLEQTARRHGAMGIASVQVGIPVRIALLLRVGPDGSRYFQEYLNPAVVQRSAERISSLEHCLSVPWGYRFTSRPREIKIRYEEAGGGEVVETLRNDEAIVFQQEMDHLEGKLLSDGLSPASFIPPDQISGFAAAVRHDCHRQRLTSMECDDRMRLRWEARTGQKKFLE